MGLFGIGKKNKPFEAPPPVMSDDPRSGGIAGFGIGVDGGPDMPGMPQPREQQGFKPNWIGVIGDAMLAAAGQQPQYMPRVRAEQQAAINRQNELADYVTKLQLKQRYETPPVNDTVADYEFWKKTLPEDQFNQWLANKVNPPQYRQGPDGSFYRIDTGAAAPAPQVAPPGVTFTPITGGQPAGQPPFAGKPANGFVPPMSLAGGRMTSGRRTPEGNKLVGGVPNSPHLSGRSADYVGPNLAAILEAARKLPGIKKAFIHNAGSGSHVHTEGEGWNTPYYGKRGTRGLGGK